MLFWRCRQLSTAKTYFSPDRMQSHISLPARISMAAFLLFSASLAHALVPPPAASFEEVVCAAKLVVVGRASDFRIVSTGAAPNCPVPNPDAASLDICSAVQVRVSIKKVLYSAAGPEQGDITFRFGGGMFSTAKLRDSLLSQNRIFYLIPADSHSDRTYQTSYPWQLGATADYEKEVGTQLKHCVR
jgi:hypothetical protein